MLVTLTPGVQLAAHDRDVPEIFNDVMKLTSQSYYIT